MPRYSRASRQAFERQHPKERLGDAPIEMEYQAKMEALMRACDEFFNGPAKGKDRQTGVVLLVFPFNELEPGGQGRCNFMSNGADRKDIITLFKEMIRRFEGQPEIKGTA